MSAVSRFARTTLLAALACPALACAQQAAAPKSLYAINSAGLGSAMSYCIAKHGALTQGSQGEACFFRARGTLASMQSAQRAAQIDRQCNVPASFNTCLTPQIGKFVYDLVAEFQKQGL